MRTNFLKASDHLIPVKDITNVDITRVEQGTVTIEFQNAGGIRKLKATGFDAIDAVMALRPSALEGKRFRFASHAWTLHNLIGHPLMQILAFAHCYKAAMWMHDATTPKPTGFRLKIAEPE